jgi:hypothetical protein
MKRSNFQNILKDWTILLTKTKIHLQIKRCNFQNNGSRIDWRKNPSDVGRVRLHAPLGHPLHRAALLLPA